TIGSENITRISLASASVATSPDGPVLTTVRPPAAGCAAAAGTYKNRNRNSVEDGHLMVGLSEAEGAGGREHVALWRLDTRAQISIDGVRPRRRYACARRSCTAKS